MVGASWVPEDAPLDRPNAARMYDYFLGGAHNFAADRAAAERALAVYPDLGRVMQANRAFLRRAVEFLVDRGIDQFLDLGSGIPTVSNVHEVAQRLNPAARVVYVDHDPVTVAHSEALLGGNPRAAILQADLREPERVLAEARRLLDWDRPLALLLVFVLHFVTDDAEARGVVRTLRDALPRGSYLVLSHGTAEHAPPEVGERLTRLYAGTPTPLRLRTRAETAPFLQGLELVEPGLTFVSLWRPEEPDGAVIEHPERYSGYAAVGRKP